MKQDFDTSDSLEEVVYDFALGLVITPILTYPFTTYIFSVWWENLSLWAGVAWLVCLWQIVTVCLVQPGRERLMRKSN